LHRLLHDEVVPTFYDRDERGLPLRWLEMVRASLTTLVPQFSAARMVEDYVQGPYTGARAGAPV
jgi:starch phosphorylase